MFFRKTDSAYQSWVFTYMCLENDRFLNFAVGSAFACFLCWSAVVRASGFAVVRIFFLKLLVSKDRTYRQCFWLYLTMQCLYDNMTICGSQSPPRLCGSSLKKKCASKWSWHMHGPPQKLRVPQHKNTRSTAILL